MGQVDGSSNIITYWRSQRSVSLELNVLDDPPTLPFVLGGTGAGGGGTGAVRRLTPLAPVPSAVCQPLLIGVVRWALLTHRLHPTGQHIIEQ